MVYHVEHLHSAQAVDDAINREGEGSRLAVVRFGRSGHDDCGRWSVTALIAMDIEEVQDFNVMYELYEPCNCKVMFSLGITLTYVDLVLRTT